MSTKKEHSDTPFAEMERHNIGWFSSTLLNRRETIEHTLDLFRPDQTLFSNQSILSRTTHLYRATSDTFEPLRQALIRSQSFVHVEVLHESSDLGIPFKVLARDREDREIQYDGALYRVTELVHEEDFSIDQIPGIAGYPAPEPRIIQCFEESLREVVPGIRPHIHSTYGFYTIKHTNWDALGFRNTGDAKLRLICKDMSIFTVTALIFEEIGKDYDVYIGDRDVTLQMIAHDLCAAMELKRFLEYFGQQRAAVERVKEATIMELKGMVAPLYCLLQKHQQWNSVKSSLKSLISSESTLMKGDLLVEALTEIVKGRFAYCNGPTQIRPPGKERDDQRKIQHRCPGFLEARLEDGKIAEPIEKTSTPMYTSSVNELRNKMKVLRDETTAALAKETDLLTAFQTEFSLYAVWLAVIALLITLVSILMAVIRP